MILQMALLSMSLLAIFSIQFAAQIREVSQNSEENSQIVIFSHSILNFIFLGIIGFVTTVAIMEDPSIVFPETAIPQYTVFSMVVFGLLLWSILPLIEFPQYNIIIRGLSDSDDIFKFDEYYGFELSKSYAYHLRLVFYTGVLLIGIQTFYTNKSKLVEFVPLLQDGVILSIFLILISYICVFIFIYESYKTVDTIGEGKHRFSKE